MLIIRAYPSWRSSFLAPLLAFGFWLLARGWIEDAGVPDYRFPGLNSQPASFFCWLFCKSAAGLEKIGSEVERSLVRTCFRSVGDLDDEIWHM